MLTISNLSKTYAGDIKALQKVDLTIPNGMFGLLGPNGAGKSTLMRTIATLQEPDNGSIELQISDTVTLNTLKHKTEIRQVLGYLPQDFGVYPRTSAEALLEHFAVLKGITNKKERRDSVQYLLEQTNLYKVRKQNVSSFSGGMRQRFGIAQALLGNPKLLIVDEPTAGLDPSERNRFHNLLAELGENIVVILSTHIVEDVADLCSEMAVLGQGRILLTGKPESVLTNMEGKIWSKKIARNELQQAKDKHTVISSRFVSGQLNIRIFSDEKPDDNFIEAYPSLEDVYFSTLNKENISIDTIN